MMRLSALVLASLLVAAVAHADEPAAADGGAPPVPVDAPAEATPDPSALANRLKDLEDRLLAIESENHELKKSVQKASRPRLPPASFTLADSFKLRLTGYVDIGFFKPTGDGVAYVRDVGHALHPEFANVPWVFLGDPWANPVNSQGDSADLGLDRTNIPRYDPIQSHGKSSFLVNTVNLGFAGSVGEHLFYETSLNFEPRQGTMGSSGDQVDMDLAYIEYKPSKTRDLHIFVGKFESTFGIEYRNRKAPDRFGITPSLIARYTTGTPTGLKIRGSFLDGRLTYNFAVTNGGMTTEKFGHFFNEIDRNDFKTLSGRLSFGQKFSRFAFEIGVSGLVGAQDLQAAENMYGWQVGADLHLVVGDFHLRAEYLHVVQQGGGVTASPMLDGNGMYAELTYQFLPWLGAVARVDFRRATLKALPNLYLGDDLRVTAGLRFDIAFNLIAKAEYVRVQELSGPEIDDDVFTTSIIVRY